MKSYVTRLFSEHADKYVQQLVKRDGSLSERNLDGKLAAMRRKARKAEFTERIEQIALREMMPKTQLEKKMRELEEDASVLGEKDGVGKMEERLGIKLGQEVVFGVEVGPLPGEAEAEKGRKHGEKKVEKNEEEEKQREEVAKML